MSVTTTTAKAANPIDQFRTQLVAMTPEFQNALPSHIKPEKFQRVVMTVVQLQPDLLGADRRSLFGACIKCAADGLVPDGREAALVMFGRQVQYMPMFTGIQKRVRNSGEIASLQAQVIYEHDEFTWVQGVSADIIHKPKFPGDRGQPIGAYAIAKFKDGSDPQIEVMDKTQIEKVRAVSRSGNGGSSPWNKWWEEMARKTVFRRLAKWLPLDAEVDELMRRDDQNGAPTVAEPSGTEISGEATEVTDEFEMASRGVTPDTPVVDGESTEVMDADLSTAHLLAQQFANCKTVEEVAALDRNPAVKRQRQGLSDAARKIVDDAEATQRTILKSQQAAA